MDDKNPEEKQEQQDSSIDRVNRVIGRGRGLYGKTRKINTALKTARTARVGAQVAQVLIATWEIWILPLLVILLVVVFVVVVFPPPSTEDTPTGETTCQDLGGTCQSSCTAPSVTDTSGATCSVATDVCCVSAGVYTCPTGNYAACLKSSFNIVVTGSPSQTLLGKIFNAYAFASKSTKFRSLFMNGGTLYIDRVSASRCWGKAVSANTIRLYDGGCGNVGQTAFTHFIVHETGHIIKNRNPGVYQAFPYGSLSQSDRSCYQYSTCGSLSGYFLKSYSLRYYCSGWGSGCILGISSRSESFAEAIANNLFSKNGYTGHLCSITIYNTDLSCPNTYSWIRYNIYGGYTFY